MDHDIHFDYRIGVSAGSANIVSYAVAQKKKNYYYLLNIRFAENI